MAEEGAKISSPAAAAKLRPETAPQKEAHRILRYDQVQVSLEYNPQTASQIPLHEQAWSFEDPQGLFNVFRRTYQYKLIKSAKPEKSKSSGKNAALVVRRIINSKGQHVKTEVDIQSRTLTAVLIEINEAVDGLSLNKVPAVAQPELFFYNRSALQERLNKERASGPPESTLLADLDTAVTFVNEQHASNIANFDSLVRNLEITWDLLWALFVPNAFVYHYHELTEQDQILQLKQITQQKRQDGTICWKLTCSIIAHDGLKFGIAYEPLPLEIEAYEGTRKIRDLPACPLSYKENGDSIRVALVERGRRYAEMQSSAFWETAGPAMHEKQNAQFQVGQYKFTTYGRAMTDASAFRTFNPNIKFIPSVYRSLDRDRLTTDQLMICSPVALGFSFGNKQWGGLAMSRLSDVSFSDAPFKSLEIDKKAKTLIHSLVKQHSMARSDGYDDVVVGKGRGLVGLLNGNPGVGKTLTAEAVAEITERPLYAVSAGELGVLPADVDKQLTLVLELAHRWQAILLLDEADVFLQERDTKDIQRNALVSIFLRQLEYYQGIIILTTNRLDACDPAFESRIHFSIHYPDLGLDARKQIWKTFLTKAHQAEDRNATIRDEDLEILARHELNGRQIKNVVGSARSIARELNQPLDKAHVETVLDVASAWRTSKKT
ncbi:MAG: hypothetical protein M1820_000920 [Bogoriella megaspora]|nr:MAG: hypothetical protein M1820_000920 [Bogoriella megaspora]